MVFGESIFTPRARALLTPVATSDDTDQGVKAGEETSQSSIGRVPPWWAVALAVLGLIAMTVGMYIYFQRDVPRQQ